MALLFHLRRRLLAGPAVLALLVAGPAMAQPSTSATENLIRLLIDSKVITKEAGDALLKQAEAEASQAREELANSEGVDPLPPAAPGTIRVPHIPEAMRAQITKQIKDDVMAQAEFEGWSRPNQVPDWIKGIKLYGDFRFRSESVFYSENNTDELLDFQQFNVSSPIDINANTNPTGFPVLNTRVDRTNRLRIRGRIGLQAKLTDYAEVGFRLATGDDNSPISTNQTLGGGFAKKSIWVDQAYVRLTPTKWLGATLGRFPNPFKFTELLFDSDINFDGVAVAGNVNRWLPEGFRLGASGGAFPLGYSGNNFPTNSIDKSGGDSKWLFSGQVRAGAAFGDDGQFDLDVSAAYHSFTSVQGQLSSSCALYNGNRQCSTDQLQPIFLRKGNTLFFLRDIAQDPASPNNFAQPQLLGLAFDYDVLDVTATAKVNVAKGIDVIIEGDYINNLSFKQSDLCRNNPKGLPINNIVVAAPVPGAVAGTPAAAFYTNPCVADAKGRIARFDGGHEGWSIRGLVGTAKPAKWGEWNVELGYRYLESDATLDSFADSDFHFGGTNAKGYTVGGTLGLYRNVAISGRWLSANEVSGPPLAIDVLQIDLTASF